MQGVPPIPLDMMLWISLGVWGLGLLGLLPIWWRNWRVSRGADIPIEEFDIHWQTITRWLLLTGTMSTLSTALIAAGRVLPFAAFMVLCAIGTATMILIAFRIDAARARRQR